MITLPWRWLAAAAAVLALLGCTWWYCNRAGAATVQRRWDAAQLALQMQRDADAVVARQASTTYQTQMATIRRRNAGLQKELRDALNTEIPSCPGLSVGAVLVPAAAVDRLRQAGADPAP